MTDRTYIAIDLKSFYASVECMDRQLDPMTTNLVVADESRTEKTICLAVSPSLKSHKIPGRARLFEVVQRVRLVNAERRHRAPRGQFTGKSASAPELQANPALELDYVVAVPVSDIFPLLIAMSLLTGFFYWFFKPISGGEFEKLRIYAIVIHRSGLSC